MASQTGAFIQSANPTFSLTCVECQTAFPVNPVATVCCLSIVCKPCLKRKAKQLLTMPLKMKQQLLAQQKSKELQFECQKCQSRHAIKEVLRWPINTVLENYLKGLAAQEDNPQKVSNSKSALLDEEDDPNARKICERCEDQKPKVVCYDCGVFGTALCKECSALIHARGSFTKHKKKSESGDIEEERGPNNAAFMCREHANAEFDKFCLTCHQLLCQKCLVQHPAKHSIRTLREGTEETMNHYRTQLDKIQEGRGRQDEVITLLKEEVANTEIQVQDLESSIRAHIAQLKYQLEEKEKDLLVKVQTDKTVKINSIVKERIKLEEFKLKEDFPLKLFEILEDLQSSKELPHNLFLLQSQYFKKLLSSTLKNRKETNNLAESISQEGFNCLPSIKADLIKEKDVEKSLGLIQVHIEETIRNLIIPKRRISGPNSEEKQKKVPKDNVQAIQLSLNAKKEVPSKESKTDLKSSKSMTSHSNIARHSAAILNKKNTGIGSPETGIGAQKQEPLVSTKSVTRSAATQKGKEKAGSTLEQARQQRQQAKKETPEVAAEATPNTAKANVTPVKEADLQSSGRNSKTPFQNQTNEQKVSAFGAQKGAIKTEDLLRQRTFTKADKSATSIKLQWDHQKELIAQSGLQVIYILEYGIGVKVGGAEQFRLVYQGSAHRCIITDLNPRTSYRIRVAAAILSPNGKEVQEMGEWSDVISVVTQDNQRISQSAAAQDCVELKTRDEDLHDESYLSTIAGPDKHKFTLNGEVYQFFSPGFIYGESEWTFGKHFFSAEVLVQNGAPHHSSVTIGLLCQSKKQKHELKIDESNPERRSKAQRKASDTEERVIIGCKVSLKENAKVDVYVNMERHLLICVANNNNIQEKFDLSAYCNCLPLVKYEGDAHNESQVLAGIQFDLPVPPHIDKLSQNEAHQQKSLHTALNLTNYLNHKPHNQESSILSHEPQAKRAKDQLL